MGIVTRVTVDYSHDVDSKHVAEAASMESAIDQAPIVQSKNRLVEADAFLSVVDGRLDRKIGRGILAYVEVVGPHHEQLGEPFLDLRAPGTDYAELFDLIDGVVGADDLFCWYGGRFIILVDRPGNAQRVLREVSRGIANREWTSQGVNVHLTPIVGYVDLKSAKSARELWEMAEQALERAKSSLEIEPFLYSKAKKATGRFRATSTVGKMWRRVPPWLMLALQFAISLIVALGGPFVLYAVCDALGADISGAVYLGVVVVLVITATTIWIEGLLALKATTPPIEPGSPFPLATLIIPAYLPNEAETIMDTLRAFLKLEYDNTVQIIVAYNLPGTHLPVEDEMQALATEQAALGRFVIEPVRVHGSSSKAQNVNAVIGRVRGRFVGIFDADHHPHADSLERAWRWLSNGWDIVQGRCSIRNGTDSWVARMVAIEFEQIYAVSHPGRARFHGFGIFGGSNGFWRTSVLHETRMRHSMLTEDIDSSIRAVVAGYKIAGDRDLVSEELAPVAMKQLLNQRLRWAQGWFQVSFRRVVPALVSRKVTFRQKLGLLHLLVWRELFPWYSIQVIPILFYWIWVYGWSYIQWTVPIFVATTIYTFSTGPGQILLAYRLAQKPMRRRPGWFIEYLFVSTFFYSPFKDALSRIAHVKEAMREKAWKVTPRAAPAASKEGRLVPASIGVVLLALLMPAIGEAESLAEAPQAQSRTDFIATLLGGEAATIHAARVAARTNRNAEAARLFDKAIRDVPRRRGELLHEYADALTYANRSAEAVPLYRELLSMTRDTAKRDKIGAQLALALTWSRQYGPALGIYTGLLKRTPNDADIAVRRARVLAWLGRNDEAVAALDKVPASKRATGRLGTIGEEILVEGARSKARTGQQVAAKRLFDRAFQRNARLRASLQTEYDSRTVRVQPSRAVGPPRGTMAYYRASLAASSPGSSEFRAAQRGLAVALTANGSSNEALDAWTGYLKNVPGDSDALLNRATLLLRQHRDVEARSAFQAAHALDQRNQVARVGIVDATISLARAAAREDRNTDAAALFDGAIKLDPGRRKAFLREYADQLSFTGRAVDAVPLYVEAIDGGTLSAIDQKRAMVALAKAYEWSDRLKDALSTYTALAGTYPGDIGFQWSKLVVGARDAARTDRNDEATDLFAKAIALDPGRGSEIFREYADQLSFTDRAEQALPFYEKALAQPGLTEKDRLATRNGLAQAYEWAGRLDQAKAAYQALLAREPGDVGLQWKVLVVSGREAARDDRNASSADFFARAIKLAPQRSAGILREYADQLSFTDRAETAIGFYRVSLNQPGLTGRELAAINRGLAQAFAWAGRYSDAKIAYKALVVSNPDDVKLRWQLLVVSAREAAAEDRNADAAKLLAQAMQLLPAQRMEILKEYADKLAYSDNAKLAIPLYREVLTQDLATKVRRDTSLSLALALAWDNQKAPALQEYQRLAAADPDDFEAALGVARMMSWAGRQSDAKAMYQQILAKSPENGEAQRGLAQAEDWDGHHRAAQTLLYRRLQEVPNDLEARRLLAQSLVWSGRPDKALDEVQRALQYERQSKTRREPVARPVVRRLGMAPVAVPRPLVPRPGAADASQGPIASFP